MNKLEQLLTDDFVAETGFYSTPAGLHRSLGKNSVVMELTSAIRTGEITTENIRTFVSQLSSSFERGIRFPYENCLAAICVSIEHLSNSFSEEFLLDLARVSVKEIPFASKVAAICLANLFQTPKTYDSLVSCRFHLDLKPETGNIKIDFISTSEIETDKNEFPMDAECAA